MPRKCTETCHPRKKKKHFFHIWTSILPQVGLHLGLEKSRLRAVTIESTMLLYNNSLPFHGYLLHQITRDVYIELSLPFGFVMAYY